MFYKGTIICILFLAGIARARFPAPVANAQGRERLDEEDARLPTTLVPYHYNVELLPYIYFAQPPLPFNGKVDIFFECVTATNIITIHNDALSVVGSSVSISVAPGSPGSPPTPVIDTWDHNQAVHFLNFRLASNLVVGARYKLSMDYTGTMKPSSQAQGLYWDFYEDEAGQTVYIAAMQGESIFARMAFPCFDEPDLKATFNITVVRRATRNFISLSNMPRLETQARPDDWFADVYAQSPIMSTYQVCIVVGEFENALSGNIHGYDVRIWARPQMMSQMGFATDIAARVQAWLDDHTGHTYPLPKMDHIALPNKGGAMENWGLITYGEESMAVNPETSPAHAILNVASIVSHELAHQWYGNLVTCKWWDDIWLNEGFATNYNYYPTLALGWEASENQQSDNRRGVIQYMEIDARNNSDPVRKNTPNGLMAPAAFSGSTYPKGGALLRMISGILTNETFARGLTRYLSSVEYTGAVTEDLWAALNAQAAVDEITNPDGSALDIGRWMDPWFNQMGYPLVHVQRTAGTAVVRQSHFLNPPNQIMDTPSQWNYKWDIPLTVVHSQSTSAAWDAPPVEWLNIDSEEVVVTGLPSDINEWVIFNSKGRMYYRVQYDDASLAAIVETLNTNPRAIEGQTKTAFIDDQFFLSRSGRIREVQAMSTTPFLADEFEYNPWYPVTRHFASVERLITKEPWFASYQAYVLSLTVPVYSNLGWDYYESETPIKQYLKRDMIALSCANGWFNCVDEALQQYYRARADTAVNVIAANNVPAILCTGIQTFSGDWNLWFSEYLNRVSSQIRDERYAYLYGLACTNFQPNLHAYMSALTTTSSSSIASRDKNTAAGYLALNDYGAILLWDYLDNNWSSPAFSGKFTTLTAIANGFSGQSGLDQLNSFIQRHPPTSATERNSYAQMILTVEQNIRWLNNNRDELRDWLAAQTAQTDPETLASRMYPRLAVSPIHHWINVMNTDDDMEIF